MTASPEFSRQSQEIARRIYEEKPAADHKALLQSFEPIREVDDPWGSYLVIEAWSYCPGWNINSLVKFATENKYDPAYMAVLNFFKENLADGDPPRVDSEAAKKAAEAWFEDRLCWQCRVFDETNLLEVGRKLLCERCAVLDHLAVTTRKDEV